MCLQIDRPDRIQCKHLRLEWDAMLYQCSLNLDRRVSILSTHNFPPFSRVHYSYKNRLTGSIEQSPRFTEQFHEYLSTENIAIMPAETQLREDLADAMRESPRDSGELITFYGKTKNIRRIEFCGFGF